MKKLITTLVSALLLTSSLASCGYDDASIGIIGGADGPTAVFVTEVATEEPSLNDSETKADVTLYFGDSNAEYLIGEERTVTYNKLKGETLEYAIVRELIRGPETEGLVDIFPEKVAVLSAVTENGTCKLDMSEAFCTDIGGTAGTTIALQSILCSLCELDYVDNVLFLCEGEVIEEYAGHYVFEGPLEANYDMVNE